MALFARLQSRESTQINERTQMPEVILDQTFCGMYFAALRIGPGMKRCLICNPVK